MKNSKLLQTLVVLPNSEREYLSQWLKERIYAKNKTLWAFFQLLSRQLLLGEQAHFEKEYLFKKLFPKQNYDDGKMRKLIHVLWTWVEEFILLAYAQTRFNKHFALLDFYKNHYHTDNFVENVKILQKQLSLPQAQDLVYWQAKAKLEAYQSTAMAMKYVLKDSMNIPNVIESQRLVFYIEQLQQFYYLLANGKNKVTSEMQTYINQLITEIKAEEKWLKNKLLNVYYQVVGLFLYEEQAYFSTLRKMVITQNPIIEYSEWATIAFALRNYINRKKMEFVELEQTAFDLYWEHLPLGFVFSNNRISPQTFLNIVETGIDLGELAKVGQFMIDYQKHLPPNIQENVMLLANAFWACAQKEYSKGLKLLLALERFEHAEFELVVRRCKIKIVCTMQDYDYCLQLLYNYHLFIYRHQTLNDNAKQIHYNWQKYVQRYCEMKLEGDTNFTEMSQALTTSERAFCKPWLQSLFKTI